MVTPMVRDSAASVVAYDHRRLQPECLPEVGVTLDYEAVLAHLQRGGMLP
ncbi:MAG: hypothetical protein WCG47_33470 [Dermatophilaceae bacterium]